MRRFVGSPLDAFWMKRALVKSKIMTAEENDATNPFKTRQLNLCGKHQADQNSMKTAK